MNNSEDYFLKQMKGVTPIKKNNKIKKEEKNNNYKIFKKNKTIKTDNKIAHTTTKQKTSDFNLERVSIKKNIKKRLFIIDKKIDFHGKNLLESEEKFSKTILECYSKNQRCLLFVTGKGLFRLKKIEKNDQPKLYYGVIRSAFIDWAKSNKFSKYILAFEKASIEHGGDGAFYVYLRKKRN